MKNGEELFSKIFGCREEAYFLEEAVLMETRRFGECPNDLIGWAGFTEVRKMNLEDLVTVVDFYTEKLEEIGKWRFALTYLSMTDKQRDEMLSLLEDS